MENEIVIVRQLPIIEERLLTVKAEVEKKASEALSLLCSEETRAAVKKVRADLNKDFAELESLRKNVKASVMQPYEKFEQTYKECVTNIFRETDQKLAAKINDVENVIRDRKRCAVIDYFNEYSASLGIVHFTFEDLKVPITISTSETAAKKAVKAFLDQAATDIRMIKSLPDSAEIMAEYMECKNASLAVETVQMRNAKIEEAKSFFQQTDEPEKGEDLPGNEPETPQGEVEFLSAPVVTKDPESEKVLETAFRVRGTIEQLRALKQFLIDGGFEYEQL